MSPWTAQHKHRWTRVAAVLTVMLAATMSVSALIGAPARADGTHSDLRSITQRGAFGQHGQWIVDGSGRVFLTAGVNMVYKHHPYAADAVGFGADDADWLSRNGFDSVRLGIIWKAVEPQPGHYDNRYLDRISTTIEQLSSRGIAVLVDSHQDMYNERFQGEFAPDWAVIDDGLPSAPQVGFPANQAVNVGLVRAYDNFLANRRGPGGVGLIDRYAAMWQHVAARLGTHSGVLGFDLLNEPWPGSAYPSCYLNTSGCDHARAQLDSLHNTVAAAITKVDPNATIYYEPYSIANQGIDMRPGPIRTARQSVLSWHVYCSLGSITNSYVGCSGPDSLVAANATRAARANGSASLLTEFGATSDGETLNSVINLARTNLVGWQYWAYCSCGDPTTQSVTGQQLVTTDAVAHGPVKSGDVQTPKLRILAAPHLRAVAGIPTATRWDPQTRRYVASWRTTKATGGTFGAGSISEVAVPSVNYPGGYQVSVTNGRVVGRDGSRVFVASDGQRDVTVTVAPR